MATQEQKDLLALCAITDGDARLDWSVIARVASRDSGIGQMLGGEIVEDSAPARKSRLNLQQLLEQDRWLEEARSRVEHELSAAQSVGARLVTVLDDTYPTNLRLIVNLPPFMFVRGDEFTDPDVRSVAVVGTRKPSAAGLRRAERMAKELTRHGVTVVSGLAAGIDTKAHRTTLANNGRTIAVIGTGITKVYPDTNTELSEEIATHGILVSQFWPSAGPARWTFPKRNVVMSGIAQGTVVIEAKSTSGAKMQARLALEHGKQAFLVKALVTDQPWAKTYVAERGAVEVETVNDVISRLADPDRVVDATRQRQLTLELT